MRDRQSLDRYFTEQVVGAAMSVSMGPSDGIRSEPSTGLRLHALRDEVELLAHAASGIVSPGNAGPVVGRPVSLAILTRTRRRVLVLGLLAILAVWSAGLWWAFMRFAR